jgi:Zn-finger nucleic acid-binding protein
MNCPKCNGELKRVDVAGTEVDQCEQCCGVWFGFGELEQVLNSDELDQLRETVNRDPARDEQRGSCPSCGQHGKMVRIKIGGIHIDSCSRCYGQWLDAGELETLRSNGSFQTVADFFKNLS